jgi:hypothetical protein
LIYFKIKETYKTLRRQAQAFFVGLPGPRFRGRNFVPDPITGAGERPKPLRRAERHAQFSRRLFLRQPNEETNLHDFGGAGVHSRQSIQSAVQREEFVIRLDAANSTASTSTRSNCHAMLDPFLPPSRLDENPPPSLRRGREEMGSILKLGSLVPTNRSHAS